MKTIEEKAELAHANVNREAEYPLPRQWYEKMSDDELFDWHGYIQRQSEDKRDAHKDARTQ